MTPQGAARVGLDVIPVGIRFTSERNLSEGQRRELSALQFGGADYQDAWIVGDEPPTFPTDLTGANGWWITTQWVDTQPSSTLIQAGIIGATLLLVLLVVAIGLSLAAAESRDERNTLIAVGASPSTLRRRSATTASLLAVTGGVLAVPCGWLPVWVVNRAQDFPSDFDTPWLSIVAIIVVVPVLVGAVALVGSAIGQRLHPPQVMQRMAD
jgi:putative ABC transport system permease protein